MAIFPKIVLPVFTFAKCVPCGLEIYDVNRELFEI